MALRKMKRVYNISFLVFAVILLIILLGRIGASFGTTVDDIWGTRLDLVFFGMLTLEIVAAELGAYYSLKSLLFPQGEKQSKVWLHIIILQCSLFVLIRLLIIL